MGDATPLASLCFILFGLLLLAGLVFGGFLKHDPPDDESDWHQMPE